MDKLLRRDEERSGEGYSREISPSVEAILHQTDYVLDQRIFRDRLIGSLFSPIPPPLFFGITEQTCSEAINKGWGGNLFRRFYYLFSESSYCLLRQHGSWYSPRAWGILRKRT